MFKVKIKQTFKLKFSETFNQQTDLKNLLYIYLIQLTEEYKLLKRFKKLNYLKNKFKNDFHRREITRFTKKVEMS